MKEITSPKRSRLRWLSSFKTRLLVLLLGVMLLTVIAIVYLGLSSFQQLEQAARQNIAGLMRQQVQEYLLDLTVGAARENDLILERVRTDAKNTAQYATSIFNAPHAFDSQAYWSADERMFYGPEGQYMNGPEDATTVFAPNTVDIDEEFLTDLNLTAHLDFIFEPVYQQDSNTVAIYIITKRELSRLYPNIELGAILPPDFLATEDIFYTIAAPENNPNKETVWTPVYDDPAGQGLLVSAIAPIYTADDEFLGVIGIDVSLEQLAANIRAGQSIAGAYSFLIDGQGRAIALPPQGYQDILGRAPQAGEFGADLDDPASNFAPVLAEMKAGKTGFAEVEADGNILFVAYAPLKGTGWSLGTVIKAESILGPLASLQDKLVAEAQTQTLKRLMPLSLIIVAVVLGLGLWLANRLVNPLQQLAAAAQKIGAGEWDTPLPPPGPDEVGILAQTTAEMAQQLQQMVAGLENQITARTRRLEVVTVLGERLSAILDVDALLEEVVNQIKENFGYYHTHIYLLDEAQEKLVVAAGTGQAGAEMKAKGHSIPLNAPTSLVARAARSKQVVRVDNVRESPNWLPNPLLPDTRSEMAVPIVVEGETIGVLDVQQDEVAGLDEGDANLLRSLANQVAVAIRNARLFEDVENALTEARAAQEQYIEQAWQKTTATQAGGSYTYNRPGAVAIPDTIYAQAEALALTQDRPTIIAINGNDANQEPDQKDLAQTQDPNPKPQTQNLEDTQMDIRSKENRKSKISKMPDRVQNRKPIVAPVRLRDKTIGTFQLHKLDVEESQPWSEDDLALVEAILDQVAQAAENIRLFEETRERAGRERTIREITDKLRASPNLNVLLETAARELGQRLGVRHTVLELGIEADSNGKTAQNDEEPDYA